MVLVGLLDQTKFNFAFQSSAKKNIGNPISLFLL